MSKAAAASRRAVASSASPAPSPVVEPLAESVAEPVTKTYPVTLILANDGARGDSEYVVDMTEGEILRLLRDDETPRYVRLPNRYNSHIPGLPGQGRLEHETRWVRLSNIAEVHVGGGWQPPSAWEWGVDGPTG